MRLARLLYLVKNMRGVLHAHKPLADELAERMISALRRSFRYRVLGYTRGFEENMPARLREGLRRRPFTQVALPHPSLQGLVEAYSQALKLSAVDVEALVIASATMTPLIVPEIDVDLLEPLVIKVVRAEKPLNMASFKLHLRIAGYTIIDVYVEEALKGYEVVEKLVRGTLSAEEAEEFVKHRVTLAEQDTRRYWRVSSATGTPVIAYLDLASALAKSHAKLRGINLRLDKDWAPLALSVVTAIAFKPG